MDTALYENLYESNKDVTQFDNIIELMELLRKMDPLGMQVVAMIIKQHTDKINNTFEGEIKEDKATFDVRNFDPVLKSILFDLCNRHLTKVTNGDVKIEYID